MPRRQKTTTFVTDDAQATIASDAVEIVIDATGSPAAGIRHALACCEHGKHIVMVNVEAVAHGAVVPWQDVAAPDNDAVRFRREMEAEFAGEQKLP